MPRYKVQNISVKAGFIADAEDKIEEVIQPCLDHGAKNGWTLHSFQATAAAKGANLVFIWQLHDEHWRMLRPSQQFFYPHQDSASERSRDHTHLLAGRW